MPTKKSESTPAKSASKSKSTPKKGATAVADPVTVENVGDLDSEAVAALLNDETSTALNVADNVQPEATGTGTLAGVEYTESEIADIRESAKQGADAISERFFSLGEILSKISKNALYSEWGYSDYASYVEGELNLGVRSAQYMVSTYDAFGKMPQEIQTWIKSLGWAKAKEMVGKVDESNWQVWRAKIAGLTVEKIKLLLKGEKGSKGSKGEGNDNEKGEIYTKTSFSLAPDQTAIVNQAIDKAKSALKSDKAGYALTQICVGYIADGEAVDLKTALSRIEAAFGVHICAFEVQSDSDSIVYGLDTLNAISEVADEDGEDGEGPEDGEEVE